MKSDGSDVTKLTSFTEDPPYYLDGSQDGAYITFSRYSTPTDSEIWIMEDDGSNMTALTSDDYFNRNPHFNDQGDHICFTSRRGGLYYQVFKMKANGLKQVELTSNRFDAYECDWGYER